MKHPALRRPGRRPGHGLALALVPVLAACGSPHAPERAPAPAGHRVTPPIGGDRDAHGCLAPAGYRWCERSARCERPWVLAREQGFENTAEGFAGYCAMPVAR